MAGALWVCDVSWATGRCTDPDHLWLIEILEHAAKLEASPHSLSLQRRAMMTESLLAFEMGTFLNYYSSFHQKYETQTVSLILPRVTLTLSYQESDGAKT